MNELSDIAAEELRRIAQAGLLRRLRPLDSSQGCMVQGETGTLLNFSSNDYLGLANSPELQAAMIEGVQRYGAGSGASRLVCGSLAPHTALEEALALFKGTKAALTFSSGYATALGVIPALFGKEDVIILDKLSHASLIDAARLSGATLRVFPHNHLGRLADLLQKTRSKQGSSTRILVVTESVFSMDGDMAPLREMTALAESHGAMLLVDEAHAVGVLGPGGRGCVAALGLEKRVALQMGTLSKALGLSGGYLAASRAVVDLLINRARSFIYSTAPPPAVAFAAGKSLELVQGARGSELRSQLQRHIAQMQQSAALHTRVPAQASENTSASRSAIIPLIIGDETAAVHASEALRTEGFFVPAIRYPTVARGTARLRVTLSALHEPAQIESFVAGFQRVMIQLPPSTPASLEESAE